MKKLTSTLTTIGRTIILPMLAFAVLSVTSCKKEATGKAQNPANMDAKAKDAKLRSNTAKVLKDFIIIFNPSNQQGTGGGSSNWSNVATNVTSYSTPTTNVYSWSDPTTGTSFTLTQSTTSGSGGGGGLGQLAYAGKSFDYNILLSIKASSNDPQWSGFFNGRDLRGAIAIDGQLTATDYSLKNIAIFLIMTNGGSGTYKFIDFGSNTLGNADGVGELLDFSDVTNNTTAGMSAAKVVVASDGHITVSDQSFDMNSDAKVTDVTSGAQYTISGSLMFL